MSNRNQNLVKLLSGEDIKFPFLKIEKNSIIVKNLSSIKGLQFKYKGNAQFSSTNEQNYATLSDLENGKETSWFISASNKTGNFLLANLAGESLVNTIDDEIKIVDFVSDKNFIITSAILVQSKNTFYKIDDRRIININNSFLKQSSNFESISFQWNDNDETVIKDTILTTNFEPNIIKNSSERKNIKIGDIDNVSSYSTKI